ncbi:hypothetical protein [Paratissierella segnis]|jgi:uncharacterized ferredoxin-like protein|uniref:Asparagine synthase n=1 Tax=Paratissierella segnis TaxID=2763679 RepID=A0A926ILX8_9FIRM|nr:hypothetical protein [Paratissierella segnis]MBC8589093.1 asparagine synthase [Paratissierella segnis]
MRKGILPAMLGIAVTGATIAMTDIDITKRIMHHKGREAMLTSGLIGFGLAHVVLGGLDLINNR